jgi:hypothetical protein
MISLGMDDETIIKVTELPAEKIAQLRSESEPESEPEPKNESE